MPKSLFSEYFPPKLAGADYQSYQECLGDEIRRVELLIDYYVECCELAEEIEKQENPENLASTPFEEMEEIAKCEYRMGKDFLKGRQEATGDDDFNAFNYIKIVYKLSDIEAFCLLLSMLPEIDSRYEQVFNYLRGGNTEEKKPDYELAIKLYHFKNKVNDIPDFYELLSDLKRKLSSLCFDENTFEISSRLLSFILSNGVDELDYTHIYTYTPFKKEPLIVMEELAQRIATVIEQNKNAEKAFYFYMCGNENIGKKTQVKRAMQITNMAVVMIDVAQLDFSDEKSLYNLLMTAFREALINQGAVCLYNFDYLYKEEEEPQMDVWRKRKYANFMLNTAQQFANVIFVLAQSGEKKLEKSLTEKKIWINIPLRELNKKESIAMWGKWLKMVPISEELEDFEMANKFSFLPGQIVGTCQDAAQKALWNEWGQVDRKELCKCAYAQASHHLERLATLIYAKHTWGQLVLPNKEKEMLKNACGQIKFRHIVYDEWQFNKRLAYGTGVSMMFAGPPGTGKTMAAQVVANELDIEIYKVNLSQIVSKWIGETEKNLNTLFEEAKKSNVILFFDETDAILGKRTEVKDSHDKNANLETSFLLQKMEEYDGITVLSTNYLQNIDPAFFRRINYVIHFPFPDVESRKHIWETIFPEELPLDKGVDFDYLANQFEIAGGNIKNIAVSAAFLAAESRKTVKMKHIVQAVKYELTKQGKVMLKEDFGELGYLFEE